MAIYIYKTADGTLVSYCPGDADPIAPANMLTANGLTALSGQPPLDATHAWSPGAKTVTIVAALKSIPSVLAFWQRFTPTEREAIENAFATGTQGVKNAIAAFKTYATAAGQVDINDPYVQAKVQQLETTGIIAAGRAAQILV